MKKLASTIFAALVYALAMPSFSAEVDHVYFSDGSCKPGANKVCVTKDKLIEMCRKTKAWYPSVFASLGVLDGLIRELNSNMGKSAFQNIEVYISKSNDCMIRFDAVGSVKGTSYNKTYYCPVDTIEDDQLNKADSYAVKSVNIVRCIN